MTEAQSTPAVEGALDRLNRDRGKPTRPRPAEQLSPPAPAALSIVPSQAVRDGPDRMASSAATAERQLLGGLILEGAAATVMAISALVEASDFYQPRHQVLFGTLLAMAREGEDLFLVNVVRRVQGTQTLAAKVGGLSYISALGDDVVSTVGLDRRAQEVRAAAIRRSARLTGQRVKEWLEHAAHDESVDLSTVLARAIREVTVLEAALGRVGIASGPDPDVWGKLVLSDKKEPICNLSNCSIIFQKDSRWKTLRLNRLGNLLEWEGRTWEQGASMRCETARWLAEHYSMNAKGPIIEEALLSEAASRAYHPVEEYLRGLVWDGEPRIHRLLTEVLGVPDSELHQLYVRRFLISAVARALKPGCKVDTALILVGAQGAMKSSFFKVLFGDYFGDSPIPIGDKDAAIQLAAVWGYEAAEMESLNRSTAEAVKQFLSTASDLYRTPFERSATKKDRRSVLCGSTNRVEFLTDDTGSRRFMPISIADDWLIRLDDARAWRDQLWAEAVAAYQAKEAWWFTRDEERDLGQAEDMALYQQRDAWEEDVRAAVRNMIMGPLKIDGILIAMKLTAQERNRTSMLRVASILTYLGYISITTTVRDGPDRGKKIRHWVRKEAAAPEDYQP